ncbi:MAG: glycine betaine ABC transporter substrate-binding protein [Fastidiosipilaceae bacterium]|jgi:glycine betaine/choline ABC-type transport system substrate-binding protein
MKNKNKRNVSIKRIVSALLSASLLFAVTSCGKKAKTKTGLIIYDGQFSEMKIIHRMVKHLVEDQTDLTVELRDEMSPVNNYNLLVDGGCDLMNSYDGTLLTTYLKMDPLDVPEDMSLYDFANQQAMERSSVRLLDKMGIDNTYAIAVPEATAREYNLKTISDLVAVAPELTFGAEHEFFSEEGSMKYRPFTEHYGLDFKDSFPVDISLKYSAIEKNMFDVTEVYATDGLNRKANLVLLEDDKNYFPEYNGALLVRDDLFEEVKETAPDLEEVLNGLGGTLTNEKMTDMSYAVDIEGKSVDDVAIQFLQEVSLID